MSNLTTVQFQFSDIAIATARYFGIESHNLKSRSRKQKFARHRWVAMYLAREMTPLSYPQLGEKFHRDHSTIIMGRRRAAELIEQDEEFAHDVEAVRAILAQSTPFRKIMYAATAGLRPKPIAGELAETWV